MKDNVYEDFEDYLQNELTKEDREEFDKRLQEDEAFAASFSVYKEIEDQMRLRLADESKEEELVSTLSKLNKKHFKKGSSKPKQASSVPIRRIVQWASGIAAGIGLYFAVSILFFSGGPDARQMADEYFAENFTKLGQTMGGAEDSLQLGIVSYNAQDYEVAQTIFEDILQRDPLNSEAEKILGLTHLAKNEFDQALGYFENLASRNELYVNQGKFFQAMVLLKRGNTEDLDLVEKLLKEVVNLQLAGHLEAKRWLESL